MTDHPNRFPPRSNKTKRFVRKGIPPDWRGAAWFYYAGGPAVVAKHAGLYDDLLKQKAKPVDVEAIERDLHRTFPDNIKFRSCPSPTAVSQEALEKEIGGAIPPAEEKPMIISLRRVLHAFAIYNPRIGYCQSLNFLAGLLLLFVETEEHAFWLLNIIARVYLPGTHETSLEGANVDLGVLMSSLRESMPHVWAKIGGELDGTDAVWVKGWRHRHRAETTRLPPITLCMTAWFMSCFIGTLPIESTLRVWDVFFYEGSKTLFRIALAIFKIGENEIKAVADPMEIFQVVQTIPRRLIDANGLIEACFRRRNGFGHLSQETVEQKRQERRVQVKAEREKQTGNLVSIDSDFKKKGTLFSRRRERGQVPGELA
ncbi:RabGAP/TBC [Daldinia bambusicola]|nr:RabGAP/TBC [Daldinia bambusicola]